MTATAGAIGVAAGAEKRAPKSDRSRAERNLAWKLVAPAVVIMLVVSAYPMFEAIYYSFFRYQLTDAQGKGYIGLQNYQTVLTSRYWWDAVFNTIFIMVVTVAVELVIGFAFAMVMHRVVFGRGVMRTAILIPYGIITVVSAFSWQFAFSLNNGFINDWFHWVPGISMNTNWFGSHWPAMFAICVSEIWKTTPFMSLLLLAGLSQVSEDMIEAAKVDGATWFQRLYKVILPNMRAAIMVAVLFRALDAFRIFDNIYVMTKGAVDTASVSFLTYAEIEENFQVGLGSALSILLFISVLIIAFLLVKLFRVDLASARGEG